MSIYDNAAYIEIEGQDSSGDLRRLTIELHWEHDAFCGIVTKIEGIDIDDHDLGRYLCIKLAEAIGPEPYLEKTEWKDMVL